MQAYEAMAGFSRRSSLRTWLFGIARHRCLDALKVERRRRRRFPRLDEEQDRPAAGADPEAELAALSLGAALAACLRGLAPRARAAVLLRYQQGLSYVQIAALGGERAAPGPGGARPSGAAALPRAAGARSVTRCGRFEAEALLAIEQGLPLDEHFGTCPDCRQARAAYERLRDGLASLDAELEPPPHWQARTWKWIAARRVRRRRWVPWTVVGGLAAALAALVLLRNPNANLTAASLRVELEARGATRRGDEAHPGDRLRLRASIGGARHAELRVYRDDRELVLRCSAEQPPCAASGGWLRDRAIQAPVELDTVGRYQPLLLVGPRPFPGGGAGLDADVAAAVAGGAEVRMGRAVDVR